jgi:hypothetical protein
MASYVDTFEEASLLREFIGVLDYVDSAPAIVERYRPPSAIARTLLQGIPRTCWQGDGLRLHGAEKPTL